MDSSTTTWTGLFSIAGFVLLVCFIEIRIFDVNSVDPDQTPHSAASDLGLHCLPVTFMGVSRLKWVKF